MPASYVEVSITTDPGLADALIGLLSQLGFEGFWEDNSCLKCFISSERWTPAMLAETEAVTRMVARSSHSTVPQVVVTNLPGRNWNEEWEKTIKPIRVTERIVITPTWHEYKAEDGQLVLTIDPKMSFGTGYHETTRLTLTLMEKHVRRGMHVLDVGTGTGVLAIAAIKLGATTAIGVDNDEWSFNNANENIRLNQVEQQVQVILGELANVSPLPCEMIVANIQRNVLEPLLSDMRNRLSPQGMLILSGLLKSDEEPMIDALHSNGFRLTEELQENEWIALAAYPYTAQQQ